MAAVPEGRLLVVARQEVAAVGLSKVEVPGAQARPKTDEKPA